MFRALKVEISRTKVQVASPLGLKRDKIAPVILIRQALCRNYIVTMRRRRPLNHTATAFAFAQLIKKSIENYYTIFM